MRSRSWLMFCFLLFNCSFNFPLLQAQHLQKPLRALTTKDGLPQSFVSGLAQDRDGFIWIGTRNGLARYDGLHFKVFRYNSKDSATLSSNLIISMAFDKRNQLWIEHESHAIDCMDPVIESITRVTDKPLFRSHPVSFIRRGWLADAAGNFYCIEKSNGLYKYNWTDQKVSHYSTNTSGLISDSIRGLAEDKQKNIWILSQRFLSRLDPARGTFEHVPIPFSLAIGNYDIPSPDIISIYQRANGEIMFGDRHQLIIYNPSQKKFRKIPLPENQGLDIHWLWFQAGPDGNDYLESKGIVYRYDDTKGLVAIGDIGLTSFRDAISFLVDRSGLIWLGTNASGIRQIDLTSPFFESHSISGSFHYDLMKQAFGISLDQFSGWPLSDKEFNSSSYFFRSAYDSLHRLWIALRNRVAYYDDSKKKLLLLPEIPDISNPSRASSGIRGISFSPKGILWVISDKGYVGYFDMPSQSWKTFMDISQTEKIAIDNAFNDILADDDKLWITKGSGDGLLCVDIQTKKVQYFNWKAYPKMLPTDQLLGFKKDPTRPELFWIGTYEGLVCLNKHTLKSEIFSVEQGLPDNTIYSIQSDKTGYLWLSTNKGLCRFHPVTHELRVFQSADGLPGNEFNRFHHLQLPDGRLAFGGTEGWTLFDPTMIKTDNFASPVAFTDLKINNTSIHYDPHEGLLTAPLNSIRTLKLPYDQNTVTFEFAGLEFNQPQKLKYKYKLMGYADDWIVTANPSINYTKLPPGHYTLNIIASNSTGQWSSFTRTLDIIIKPPFWRTWWAYSIYILGMAGIIWLYLQYRINRERMRQKIFLKEQEALQLKTVDELKTRFFSNITHEFRTPLTLILTPAQRLKSSLFQKDQLHWLSAIERNAQQLLRLINQLLDFSKLESGTLMLHETKGNISDFVEEQLRSFYDEADSNGIILEYHSKPSGDYWFDADKLEQIIRNLVANALKFTSADGKVEVALYPQGRALDTDEKIDTENHPPIGISLSVSDTGIGIPQDQLPHVFDRFYQVDHTFSTGSSSANHPKGSGIGLALVKELVELQGGSIEVSSAGADSPSWHTVFSVWLPYRQAVATDVGISETGRDLTNKNSSVLYDPFKPGSIGRMEEHQEAGGMNILLAEDNAELAEFIADSLPGSYKITWAANGAEGLEKAIALMPDLVISDVLMPVMNGYEFCRKIKQDDRTNHIPVIMLTAKASFDNRIEGLSLGADDYLTKPFHVRELQLRVHNLLERQRLLREKLRLEISQPDPTGIHSDAKPQPADLTDAFIKKLYDIIEDKLDDSLFGVQELANSIGMSRATLHRKLKAITDMSAGDIIRNYRLKRAASFLKLGHNSSETAYLVGFDSPAYFSKCFKDFYKLSPLEYIQKGQ